MLVQAIFTEQFIMNGTIFFIDVPAAVLVYGIRITFGEEMST